MSETVNQEVTENQETGGMKTFTQDEVDRIVGERLARDREKYADYDALKAKATKFDEMEEANKTELQKANEKNTALQAELDTLKNANALQAIRSKVATETGIPVNLLTAETEEACKEQAKAILQFAQAGSYPNVKDGGEVHNTNRGSTRQQFADWMNQVLN